MTKKILWIVALAHLLGTTLRAQEIVGDWQGTLKAGPLELRSIVRIAKADGGRLSATMYSIDQSTSPIPVDSVSLEGSTLKFVVDAVGGAYEGKVRATVKPAHHDHVAKVTSTSRTRFRFPQR
jgi:hypothetical protein